MSGTKVLVAAVLAASIVAPVSAVEVKPYGFVHMTYTEGWGLVNTPESPNQAVSGNGTGGNANWSNSSARGTRVGLKLNGGKGPMDMDIAGVVEMDFIGIRNPAGGTDSTATAPRLRLANIKMSKGMNTLTIGQDWTEAIAPLNPISIHHVVQAIGTGAGNLYNRLPQVRWDADWMKGSDTTVVTKVAAVKSFTQDATGKIGTAATSPSSTEGYSSGEQSGTPALQAGAELQHKMWGRMFRVGAGVQYLRRTFGGALGSAGGAGSNITGATNRRSTELLYAVHTALPILSMLEVQGEAFYGKGGETMQALNNGGSFTDPIGGGNITSRLSRGGWGQMTVKPIAGWRVSALYAIENQERAGLSTAAATPAAFKNEEMIGSLIWDVSPELALSVEGGRIYTVFANNATGAATGRAAYVGLASQYKF